MLTFALALKNKRVPVPDIATKLTIKTGKNAGKSPSIASLYRALAEAEEQDAQTDTQIVGPRRPTRIQLSGPGRGTGPELMERLTQQVLDGDHVLDDSPSRARTAPTSSPTCWRRPGTEAPNEDQRPSVSLCPPDSLPTPGRPGTS